jgi:putative hydrolase of HD superfamily
VYPSRLERQLAFLTETDRLKSVQRATTLCDGSRRENSGEHSWHIALYAMTLGEHGQPGISIDRVIRMLLIHDLVEIDTGDTPIHAAGGQAHGSDALRAAEREAARRIFGLLPQDQAGAFCALWEEFEAGETPDAVFARAVDRVQPVMANLESGGGTWSAYGVTRDQLETRVGAKVARGAPALWTGLKARLDAWFAERT